MLIFHCSNAFKLGLVVGDKHVIYPLMAWLLQRIPELQKRAYLAKFLVNVYVPPEFISDPEVEHIMQKVNLFMTSTCDQTTDLLVR